MKKKTKKEPKTELYIRQGKQAAKAIECWPLWMRLTIGEATK